MTCGCDSGAVGRKDPLEPVAVQREMQEEQLLREATKQKKGKQQQAQAAAAGSAAPQAGSAGGEQATAPAPEPPPIQLFLGIRVLRMPTAASSADF